MRRIKGYMTIEAALVMPMVFCIMALIIYFSFYLYGRCILSQDAYVLAFRASTAKSEEYKNDPVSYVSSKAAEKAGRKYFGSSFPRFEASRQGKEIRVRAKAEAAHSAMGGYFLKPSGSWEYEAGAKAKRRDYADHIRRARRLTDLGKEILNIGDD